MQYEHCWDSSWINISSRWSVCGCYVYVCKFMYIVLHDDDCFIIPIVAKDHINSSLSTVVAEARNVNLLDTNGPDVQFIVFFKLSKC